ncbi:MAG: hypothetical protein RL488_1290 [Actinomycetota bacterium]|jgi:hypothetical protein
MFKKLLSSLFIATLSLVGITATAQAAGTGDIGSIYYIGAWDMGNAQVDPFWTGIRHLNLATGEDAPLDLNSPTCSGLASSSTTGLAVDVPHKRIYWTANDGVAGVFALDLNNGKCYTLEPNGNPRGIVFSADGQNVIWSTRIYDAGLGTYVQELRTLAVTDLELIQNTSPTPGSIRVEIPGFSNIAISDLEMHADRMYALLDATEDSNLASHNFIYSFDPNDLSVAPVQESDTGVIGTPYQFQIGSNAFYVSTFDQIYKIEFGSPGATWGMSLDQIAGFALVGDNIYSAFSRDEPMKIFNINNDTNPRALDANPPVDMFSYLVYAAPMPTPTITAALSKSLNGVADVPFSGVTLTANDKLGYSIVPRDGSAPFGGFCTVVANKCRISGLEDLKIYDVTLRLGYTYQDPNDQANPTHVIMASAPSNTAQVNDGSVTPPTPSAKKAIKTLTGFEFEKGALTASTKKAIKVWLTGKTGFTKVTCVGYTGFNYNKRSNAYLTKLALTRATNVCNYIHTLNPSIVVKSKTAKLDKSKKDATRRVIATITN